MKKLTVGKRIGLGFALLVAIVLLVGGYAVFSMSKAVRGAHRLSDDYVPGLDIASRLSAAMTEVRVNGRSYQFTSDEAYLEQTLKALADVKSIVKEGEALVDRRVALATFKQEIEKAPKLVDDYERLLNETAAADHRSDKNQEAATAKATKATVAIDALIQRQSATLQQEINDKSDVAVLSERNLKLQLLNTARGVLNATRIAYFRFQAMRDSKILVEALTNFKETDEICGRLLSMLKVAQDRQDVSVIQTEFASYAEILRSQLAIVAEIAEISVRRGKAASALQDLAGKLQDTAEKGTDLVATESTNSLTQASFTTIIGVAAAVLLAIAAGYIIVRSIVKILSTIADSLSAGSDQTASAAGQVSTSAQSLAEGASEQAASLEETSASLEEVTSMTRRNAEAAAQAKELAAQTRLAADAGAADMEQMKGAMDAIKLSSGEIAKIVKTIDEIAFQTNILALNAAVEAARAGEAGMGFAVVAEEVRALAQRSAQAAKETATKIEDSVSKSENGVGLSGKVAQSLAQIVEGARKVDALVAEIAAASQEQTQGMGQVSTAVSQMDQVTQANAGNAEESAAAAEELNAQSVELRRIVSDLGALVGLASNRASVDGTLPSSRSATRTLHVPARAAAQKKRPVEAAAAAGSHNDFFHRS